MEVDGQKEQTLLSCQVNHGAKTLGYLVIDSIIGDRSWGGLRMHPDVDLLELRLLAEAMTLKFGFLGLPQGGAKAGVCFDPEAPLPERREQLAAFGKALGPLLRQRVYQPGPDMGTDTDDIHYLLTAAGVNIKPREFRSALSGYYTALSVFAGVKQACRFRNIPLSGATAAIEGFGKVGAPLAGLMARAGLQVLAISTSRGAIYHPEGLDVGLLQSLAEQAGSRVVERYPGAQRLDHAAFFELPVDVLCPCARLHTLNQENAARLKARIISPGANHPVTPAGEQALFDRGVLSLPFFVTNCGGALGGTMEFASIPRDRIADFIDQHLGERLFGLLQEATRKKVIPSQLAEAWSRRRAGQVRSQAKNPNLRQRLFQLALELYRRGLVPGVLVAPLSLHYFRKRMC